MPSGRKEYIIDWELVDKMLESDCEGTEVAARLGIHPNTLYRRVEEKFKINFGEYLKQKKSKGNSLLKEVQYDTAIDGNVPMQIWLGKQRLGQTDSQKIEHSGNVSIKPQIEFGDTSDAD